MQDTTKVSRRSFMAGMAVLGASAMAGLAGCAPQSAAGEQSNREAVGTAVPKTWDMEADVVVLGAGGAGMAAAITAKEAGSSVLVLEKANVTGGDTALCGQTLLGPWPEQQKEQCGVDDSIDAYIEDMKKSYPWGPFAEQKKTSLTSTRSPNSSAI